MGRAGKCFVASVTALVLFTGLSGPALAQIPSSTPPDTFLHAGDVQQRGRLIAFCWSQTFILYGHGMCTASIGRLPFPSGRRIETRAVRIALHDEARPTRFRVRAWTELGPHGVPKGRGTRLPVALEPGLEGTELVWNARFLLPRRQGHYYLEAFGVWDNEPSFDGGDALWTYHVIFQH